MEYTKEEIRKAISDRFLYRSFSEKSKELLEEVFVVINNIL